MLDRATPRHEHPPTRLARGVAAAVIAVATLVTAANAVPARATPQPARHQPPAPVSGPASGSGVGAGGSIMSFRE
ncbi:hypothetical protein OHA09_17775 [Streptomyces longwoodensis]|nr:hypothetical protein [Streptomyces longwoodensis]WRY89695.1 hypothetical protein OG481_14815 [Streptomyces longwoodensis]WTI46011.1 hypothetical protein OG547_16565 [Streptomyces longwoodensis]WUC58818.1 hypothetical protein OHA09_17775 [Streptomyces longwoodensis]WUC72322.1 hypothetical protein OG416_16645 [Streptomyces longwoodensis]